MHISALIHLRPFTKSLFSSTLILSFIKGHPPTALKTPIVGLNNVNPDLALLIDDAIFQVSKVRVWYWFAIAVISRYSTVERCSIPSNDKCAPENYKEKIKE